MRSSNILLIVFMIAFYEEKPLNVIIVLVDDMGYGDIAAHGNPLIQTPNFDKLHEESARFTNFAVSPTCAPTRAAIMTGSQEFLVGVTHTISPMNLMDTDAETIAELFQKKGYKTGLFGKWHLEQNDNYGPWFRGFDESLTVPGDQIVKKMSDFYEVWWKKVIIKMKEKWGENRNAYESTKIYQSIIGYRDIISIPDSCRL